MNQCCVCTADLSQEKIFFYKDNCYCANCCPWIENEKTQDDKESKCDSLSPTLLYATQLAVFFKQVQIS